MPADDDPDLLPKAPPPRPAARDAAIEMALRRFDGIPDPVAHKPPARQSWIQRPQMGLLVTASLVALVGIPATLIGLRDADRNPPAEIAAPRPKMEPPRKAAPMAPVSEPEVTQAIEEPRIAPPVHRRDVPIANSSAREAADVSPMAAAPPPSVALAPPPPPPPASAPPPPREMADKGEVAGTSAVVVTGSRIAADAADNRVTSSFRSLPANDYSSFLARLQSAIRANDRNAVIGLISFPLRVNASGGVRLYRDAGAVRRDYSRIFTSKVTRAILDQRADQLFTRDQGTMIGDGEVWFDRPCTNGKCAPTSPIRITAINP